MNRYVLTLFLVLPIALLEACNRQHPKTEKASTPVQVAQVEMFTPAAGERYSASLAPFRQVTLSFKSAGFVDAIQQTRGADGRVRNIDLGDAVAHGTVLARIRQRDSEFQVSQVEAQLRQARESEQSARAQLAQVEATAAKAAMDFERARGLLSDRALTKPEYDAAKAQYDATRAQVESARAQIQGGTAAVLAMQAALGTASLSRQDTALVAPFSGVLVSRSLEVGGLAAPGNAAFVLADVSSVKAAFGVPDRVVVQMKTGAKLTAMTEAIPGRTFTGIVTAIAGVADSSTRLFQVELSIPNPDHVLRPGMTVSLAMNLPHMAPPVPVVPIGSIVRPPDDPSGFAVLTLDGNIARRRKVTLGATFGDRIAVGGLKPGERIISAGANFVSDGQTVEVIQ
jgi:RND family efflux transporter MFP subunit